MNLLIIRFISADLNKTRPDIPGFRPTGPSNSGVYLCEQCLEDSSSHCPFPVELVTNRVGQGQGRAGHPLRGATQGAISIKKILGENRGTCI